MTWYHAEPDGLERAYELRPDNPTEIGAMLLATNQSSVNFRYGERAATEPAYCFRRLAGASAGRISPTRGGPWERKIVGAPPLFFGRPTNTRPGLRLRREAARTEETLALRLGGTLSEAQQTGASGPVLSRSGAPGTGPSPHAVPRPAGPEAAGRRARAGSPIDSP